MDVVATHPYLEEELLIDATIRHPSSVKAVKAASEPAAAAIEGENEKFKRYPPTRGKRVVPAAMETWGRIGPHFMSLLLSLHAHGRRRDIAHGCPAGNYLQRWFLMLSSTIARTTAKAMFDAMYAQAPQGGVLPPSSVIDENIVRQTHISFLQQTGFPVDDWLVGAPSSHVPTPVPPRVSIAVPVGENRQQPSAKAASGGAKTAPVLPIAVEEDELDEVELDLPYSPATPPAVPSDIVD